MKFRLTNLAEVLSATAAQPTVSHWPRCKALYTLPLTTVPATKFNQKYKRLLIYGSQRDCDCHNQNRQTDGRKFCSSMPLNDSERVSPSTATENAKTTLKNFVDCWLHFKTDSTGKPGLPPTMKNSNSNHSSLPSFNRFTLQTSCNWQAMHAATQFLCRLVWLDKMLETAENGTASVS